MSIGLLDVVATGSALAFVECSFSFWNLVFLAFGSKFAVVTDKFAGTAGLAL